jgi:hypothetical protein
MYLIGKTSLATIGHDEKQLSLISQNLSTHHKIHLDSYEKVLTTVRSGANE